MTKKALLIVPAGIPEPSGRLEELHYGSGKNTGCGLLGLRDHFVRKGYADLPGPSHGERMEAVCEGCLDAGAPGDDY